MPKKFDTARRRSWTMGARCSRTNCWPLRSWSGSVPVIAFLTKASARVFPEKRAAMMKAFGAELIEHGRDFDEARERARKRLQDRRDFTSHVVAYIVVNAFLIGVWALTDYGGYFWPVWVLAAWGVGLVLHAYELFFHRPVSEADVDAEIRRGR